MLPKQIEKYFRPNISKWVFLVGAIMFLLSPYEGVMGAISILASVPMAFIAGYLWKTDKLPEAIKNGRR